MALIHPSVNTRKIGRMGRFRLLLATVGTISGFHCLSSLFSLSGFSIAFLKVPLMIGLECNAGYADRRQRECGAASISVSWETTDLHSNMMDFDYYKGYRNRKIRIGTYRKFDSCLRRNEVKTACWWITRRPIQGAHWAIYGDKRAPKTVTFTVYKALNLLWITRLETSATMSLIMVWTICT